MKHISLACLLALVLPLVASAATTRASTIVSDGSRYYRKAALSTTAVAVAFPVGPCMAMSIYNEGTTALLVRFVRAGVAVAAAELTAPVDSTWSEVQSIPAGKTLVFDVRGSAGLIMDRATGTGAVTLRALD